MRLCLLVASVLNVGCTLLFHPPGPMDSAFDPLPGDKQARCLVVLLPGVADTAEVFREKGFVEAIRNSGLSTDIVSANATVGYYLDGSAAQRIEAVVAPLRRRGYEQIWLVGVSMGGLGTLQYSQAFPDHVDGILALAPYLGDAPEAEIREAGGLAKWSPDPQRQPWSWLRDVVTGKLKGPAIYVGYGDRDAIVGSESVLSTALPADRVLRTSGAHDWQSWRAVLDRFLKDSEFQRRCAR
jgi:pimeloyl-ACP methyl ester carboxylesterase